MATHRPISIPLLALAIYCTLADSFGGLKGRGRRREIRHHRRVSYSIRDEVEDKR